MSNAGSSTIKGPFIANGGATFSNDNFKIEVNTGNTDINGKVYIDKTLTVQEDTFIEGDFSCSSGQFRIKNDSGNTSIDINGALNINSAATFYDIFRLVDSNNITIVNFNTAADSKSYVLGGNFGVGITVPEYKLDVNGDLNLGEGYMYKINGVDVVFSQWETLYGKHISYNKNGSVFINIADVPANADASLTVGGNVKITNSGDLILNGKNFEQNVIDIIPESPWKNEPDNSTVEDGNIDHLYSNYPVILAKNMAIGTTLEDKYSLNIKGDTNIQGSLYFSGEEFIPNLWKIFDNSKASNLDSKYIYFSTTNDPFPAISYVGIGTSTPKYNLDVNGDINITGNLLINGNGVIFPDPEDGVITAAGWSEGGKTQNGTILYYNSGFVGIGTESPSTNLQIRGDLNSNGNLFDILSQNYASYLSISRVSSSGTTQSNAAQFGFEQTTSELLIRNNLADGVINITNAVGTGSIYMDVNGNIGLGTVSPKDKFHVRGGAMFDNDINIGSDGQNVIINNLTSAGKATPDNNSRIAIQHSANDILSMDPNSGYEGGLKLSGTICIVPQPNLLKYVGINNSTPQYTLDIDGSINYTGTFYKDKVEQFFSQWHTYTADGGEYIQYPVSAQHNDVVNVGIGTNMLPSGTLEVFDRKNTVIDEYYPQLVVKSTMSSFTGYNQGTCIELNTSDSLIDYKGIRMHTVNEGANDLVGFAIDTNNSNNLNQPFKNLFYLNSSGDIGLGDFLTANPRQYPRGKLHIMNPTTEKPALIITDNAFPGQPENNVSDLNIICSRADSNNLGNSSKIIGINIQEAISTNNTLLQNASNSIALGAVAINMSAGGANGGATSGSNYKNGSAFGVLFTNVTGGSAGAGQTLEENFTIAYNGNVGIRSYSTATFSKAPPKFGLNINHSDQDTDATGRFTGSINISGFYYKDGKKLHLPWTYWTVDDPYDASGNPVSLTNYSTPFDLAWSNGSSSTLNSALVTTMQNSIHEVDSVVGIGTTQPRGALDVRGSIYSKYGVISSDKYPFASLTLYHSRMEAIENFSNPTKYSLLSDANGDLFLNSQNNRSVLLTNDGTHALFCTGGWVHIPNGIDGNLWCNGAVRVVGRLNIGRNDPGGGSGDQSYLEYVVISGEQTVLRIVCANDANDNINLSPTGNVGIKTDQPGYTLHVNGNCGATHFYATSDYRLKNDVETLKDEKYNIDSLRPVSYTLKETQKPALGFIAHEVQEHFPEMVSGEKDGDEIMQSIEYNQMIPLLVKEIQELKAKVKELESKQK